jgi:hypothetical protein
MYTSEMRAACLAIISLFSSAVADFTYKQGFLAAGDDLLSGSYTYEESLALCTANDLCMGFTFMIGTQNSTMPPDPVNVFFKSSQNYVCCDAAWATYMKTAPPQWPDFNFTVVRVWDT